MTDKIEEASRGGGEKEAKEGGRGESEGGSEEEVGGRETEGERATV